jgi:hypothetical protein
MEGHLHGAQLRRLVITQPDRLEEPAHTTMARVARLQMVQPRTTIMRGNRVQLVHQVALVIRAVHARGAIQIPTAHGIMPAHAAHGVTSTLARVQAASEEVSVVVAGTWAVVDTEDDRPRSSSSFYTS